MANYRNILPFVRKWEGGLVYFKEEGQWTNKGVQWTTYLSLAEKLLGEKNPTLDKFKKLTDSQQEKFIEYFWNIATNNNQIDNQAKANALFEFYWGGGKYGLKWIQRKLGLYADGIIGKRSTAKINDFSVTPQFMVNEVINRFEYLHNSNPSKYPHINGWRNRWNDLVKISMPYYYDAEELIQAKQEADKKKRIV